VRLVAQGCTDREIAAALHVQHRTVRTHLEHLSEKTGTRGRVALVQWARQTGWLEEESGVDASG
jgi:DNA-binding CsgD family transcriptional regulator